MKSSLQSLATAMCFAGIVAEIQAAPLQTSNQSPLTALFGLPAPHEFSEANTVGSVRFSLANNFILRSNNQEVLALDGETLRVEFGFHRKFGECWEASAIAPYLQHSGGQLDGFVDDWHEFFGLPESDRPKAPTDRLLYYYEKQGDVLVDLQESESGVGDIRLTVARPFDCRSPADVILRAGIKLPTGDPELLTGSGGSDISLDFSKQSLRNGINLRFAGTAGLLFAESSELFPNQRNVLFYGSASMDWLYSEKIMLEAQMMLHTPFVNSSLAVLDDWPLILAFGGRVYWSKAIELEFSLSEDPVYGTSPDVVFHMGVAVRY